MNAEGITTVAVWIPNGAQPNTGWDGWFLALAPVMPQPIQPERSITTHSLILEAKGLRERAFCRNFQALSREVDGKLRISLRVPTIDGGWEYKDFIIKPRNYTAKMLMGACNSNPEARAFLAKQAIVGRLWNPSADPEVSVILQDLADILSYDATNAFKADYYPGIASVTVSEEHIDKVVWALQREVDREAMRVSMQPALYAELPRERQRALAERRRWYYAKFGVTPRSWKTGYFSLWKIKNESIDDYDWVKFNTYEK